MTAILDLNRLLGISLGESHAANKPGLLMNMKQKYRVSNTTTKNRPAAKQHTLDHMKTGVNSSVRIKDSRRAPNSSSGR